MNIKEAKTQIKNAMIAYFTKNEIGEYIVPIEKQRPVFLMGPPGIGKTAIMEQIASEMNVGLLSYSMTHHTRQSALGLPFIEHKTYKGIEYDISEYTMSEIVASIYELMEKSGVEEGILFLDEINCVSETLAPVMLQFLQYKVFGRHKIPDGWIVVTAGNPPEYNNSVREFDIVTWDRLKRVDVEPDYDVWKEYAFTKGVHASVLTYLDIKKADFYKVESTVDGKIFVTARGWDDLSQMIQLYEINGINVDENLICQYIQSPRIAKDFAVYYELYLKYKSDYKIERILEGKQDKSIISRAKKAKFDERLSLLGMILDSLNYTVKDVIETYMGLTELASIIKNYRLLTSPKEKSPNEYLSEIAKRLINEAEAAKISGNLSREALLRLKNNISIINEDIVSVGNELNYDKAFKIIKNDYDGRVTQLKKNANCCGDRIANAFKFLETAFGEGQEMLIVVTEMTSNNYFAKFISQYGCDAYFKHNKNLLFYERQREIDQALEDLKLEE